MNKKILFVAFTLIILIIVIAGWWIVITATQSIAPMILEAGPNGIDLRPTPGASSVESALPQKVEQYERGACRSIADFHGLKLGSNAMETSYTRRNTAPPYDEVRVIAARMVSYHDAAVAVRDLAQRLRNIGAEVGGRWRSEEPYEGWWSAAGKRNFLSWNAPTWNADQSGFVWQSGEWVFIVTAPRGAFSNEVSKEFPY